MCNVSEGTVPGFFPEISVLSIPYLFESACGEGFPFGDLRGLSHPLRTARLQDTAPFSLPRESTFHA
ncbi:hypothetical protein [Acetomicrobium sp. S15 = DSM 107314]|uniref:hypothetical protein n=1 Tax=Acetomicrobium sp. S15 = DSM 107314 TaxID=2529858 RepID=UPI00406C502A